MITQPQGYWQIIAFPCLSICTDAGSLANKRDAVLGDQRGKDDNQDNSCGKGNKGWMGGCRGFSGRQEKTKVGKELEPRSAEPRTGVPEGRTQLIYH